MPRATLDKLRRHLPAARPFLMYGLTEAFRSTYLDPPEVDRRPDSIGKAIPNAEILVVRPDGSRCEPGEEGELVHRGALVALGYWNDPARTAERFRPAPGRDAGWRARARRLVRRYRGGRRGRVPLLRRTTRRHDQDVRATGSAPPRSRRSPTTPGWSATRRSRPGGRQARTADRSGRLSGELRARRALLAAMRRQLPLYMVPSGGRGARPHRRLAQRQVRPRCCARSCA